MGCAILARRRLDRFSRLLFSLLLLETLRAFFPKLHDIPQNNITLIHDIQALAPLRYLASFAYRLLVCLERLTLQRLKRWDRLIRVNKHCSIAVDQRNRAELIAHFPTHLQDAAHLFDHTRDSRCPGLPIGNCHARNFEILCRLGLCVTELGSPSPESFWLHVCDCKVF